MHAPTPRTASRTTLALAAMLAVVVASSASAERVFDQGFETDTAGWLEYNSTVTRTAGGSAGIAAASGSYYALVSDTPAGDTGAYTRFDGFRDTWPGTFVASLAVYLDPAWAAGSGFDYSVAATGTDGNHKRDFIFHVTSDTSTGQLLVGASNNTNFAPREDLENIDHAVVASAGWYTLRHTFRDDSGVLAVDLELLDGSGSVLFTHTLSNPADTIPAEVGGNRYGWVTFVGVPGGLAIDDTELFVISSTTTAITGHVPDFTGPGEPVTVSFAVAPTASAGELPTGTVTVTDGVDSCTGTLTSGSGNVAEGSCQLTLTTLGTRSLVATYSGNVSYTGSTSAAVDHLVTDAEPVPALGTVGLIALLTAIGVAGVLRRS